MADEIERRFLTRPLEIRANGDEPRRIIGYGAVFEQLSEDLGGFKEMIKFGAFTETIEKDDIRSLWNHNTLYVLGRTASGTLALIEDDLGLRYEVIPPDSPYAQDFFQSVDRGDVDQSSFGFRAIEESWINPTDEEPLPIRVLRRVKLYDVGPVTFPAYPTTSAEARAKIQEINDLVSQATGQATEQGAAGRLALKRRHLELLARL
jgi:HK97 family phage prohead protease